MRKNRPALFQGRHFEDVMIMLCVRWYLRYSLSYRDLEEIMAERGLCVDHVRIWRWLQRYAHILNQRIRRQLRRPNRSWRVDETYVRVAGSWAYLYRRRFGWRNHRLHAVAQARSNGGEAFPAARLVGWQGDRAASHQCGWAPGVCPCHPRTEGVRRTGAPLSLPNIAVSQQHHRARPPIHQEANRRQPRIPVGGRSLENHRRLRGNACDSQRTDPLAGKG